MAEEEHQFCQDYLLLKSEEASCLDLARILCCNNLEDRVFFNTKFQVGDNNKVIGFRHRWILFISVLFQKVLLLMKTPMAKVGSALEMWLNYPAFNRGYWGLLFNLFTGKLVRPDETSEGFSSVVGNLDKRQDLDINVGTNHENFAAVAMMASKLSYENKAFAENVVRNRWEMEFLEFYNFRNDFQELNTTYAITFQDKPADPNLIAVAFRGTDPFNADDWCTDIDISWYDFRDVGRIHGGFMKALGLQKSAGWPKQTPQNPNLYAYYTLRDELKSLIDKYENAKFILTGHSLGGALAILFAAILTIHDEKLLLQKLEGVYTFGQPRVGDEQFGEYMKKKLIEYDVRYYRYVYCNDMVPRLPYDDKTFLFKHFGRCLYFTSRYEGYELQEEPNKNYFSLIQVVPKILNAVYELVRSFMFPWTKGDRYRESWLMKMFRFAALVIPGLTDHLPVDYINLARLGNIAYSTQR